MIFEDRIRLEWRRILQRHAYRRLARRPELKRILETPIGTTGADYSDYWALYAYIRRHRPRHVLEFGPGVTTGIMAQALFENGTGHLTTMEDVPHYHEGAKRSLPDHLRPLIDLRLSPKVEKRYGPFAGIGYQLIPERPYDFVYVDGPDYDKKTAYDVDVLEIIARSDIPVTAMVDYRVGSCFVYQLALGDKFRFSHLRKLGYIDRRRGTASRTTRKSWRTRSAHAFSGRAKPRFAARARPEHRCLGSRAPVTPPSQGARGRAGRHSRWPARWGRGPRD